MGTLARITLYTEAEASAAEGFRGAFARIAQIDRILSDYDPQSEAMQLCARPAGLPVAVSQDLFTVLAASQKLAAETDGEFDVTLGPLTHLWRKQGIPAPGDLAQVRRRTGYRKVTLNQDSRTVTLAEPAMILDFGAIGKGFAASAALAVLRQHGISRALVALSGDLAIGDPPPGALGWRIGIDSFRSPPGSFTRVLELRNTAISTSGDTEQFRERAGQRHSHIIDPATGQGLTRRIGVTVMAASGLEADSLATALSVVGVDFGFVLLKLHPGVAALFSTPDGIVESPTWPR